VNWAMNLFIFEMVRFVFGQIPFVDEMGPSTDELVSPGCNLVV